jgi:chemotaxis signal transduction protein
MTNLLWFEVGGSTLALPVGLVLEIREPGSTTAVPGAAREVLGLIQHRGRMIPVIDLARRLTEMGGAPAEAGQPGYLIVVQSAEPGFKRSCALAVDHVLGVRELAAARPAPGQLLDVSIFFRPPRGEAGGTPVTAGVSS